MKRRRRSNKEKGRHRRGGRMSDVRQKIKTAIKEGNVKKVDCDETEKQRETKRREKKYAISKNKVRGRDRRI